MHTPSCPVRGRVQAVVAMRDDAVDAWLFLAMALAGGLCGDDRERAPSGVKVDRLHRGDPGRPDLHRAGHPECWTPRGRVRLPDGRRAPCPWREDLRRSASPR